MGWRADTWSIWELTEAVQAPSNPAGYKLARKRWLKRARRIHEPSVWLIGKPPNRPEQRIFVSRFGRRLSFINIERLMKHMNTPSDRITPADLAKAQGVEPKAVTPAQIAQAQGATSAKLPETMGGAVSTDTIDAHTRALGGTGASPRTPQVMAESDAPEATIIAMDAASGDCVTLRGFAGRTMAEVIGVIVGPDYLPTAIDDMNLQQAKEAVRVLAQEVVGLRQDIANIRNLFHETRQGRA